MDAKKKQTISETMGLYQHSLADLAAWLKRVVPNVQTDAERAYVAGMNEFLGAALGREPAPKATTPIPQPADDDRLGRDLWLFLSFAGITCEDLAEYVSEALAERKEEVQRKERQMSDMLHALPTESSGAVDIFDRRKRLEAEGSAFNISSFLSNLRSGV